MKGSNYHQIAKQVNDQRGSQNDSSLRFYSLLKEKSFDEMTAVVGKNLGLHAVIAAGANIPQLGPDRKILNLPTIMPSRDPPK